MPELTYMNGYQVAQEEPDLSHNGVYQVRYPGGDNWTHRLGQTFWSQRYNQPFELTANDAVDPWHWGINWLLPVVEGDNSISFTDTFTTTIDIPDFLNEQAEAVLPSNWAFNEPFYRNNRYYVIMESGGVYARGQIWFSEYEGQDYRLGAPVRENLFGYPNTFRAVWVEPEYDSSYEDTEPQDDNYSVERIDHDSSEVAPMIATNIGRAVPLVSFEQEFSGDGNLVARRLYQDGFALSDYPGSYHGSDARYDRDEETTRMCYVETDSSCGYELIFDRIALNSRPEAERISSVQTILKNMRDDGFIRLSARCGFHVHVDVSDWGMKEIVSAYHLWNYLEDPIFRFASAFWNSHRDEEVGGGYSSPVPKGHSSRSQIGRVLVTRRDSLNFSPILNARSNCTCQATFYEDWENCTCNVRQPTLEFRVFNATLNQRKIRAYLAFCVAFVNAAKSFEFDPVTFPEMRWNGTARKLDVGDSSWREAATERIKFILEKFPLTNHEKTDIMYCLRNCSLDEVMELL